MLVFRQDSVSCIGTREVYNVCNVAGETVISIYSREDSNISVDSNRKVIRPEATE